MFLGAQETARLTAKFQVPRPRLVSKTFVPGGFQKGPERHFSLLAFACATRAALSRRRMAGAGSLWEGCGQICTFQSTVFGYAEDLIFVW
eukprot:s2535_g8.t1